MGTFYAPAGYGAPASGDTVYFYDGDTTTPAPVYEDPDLTSELGTSVTADANGGFPNIFLSDAVSYKVVIIRDGGDLGSPLKTTYPINSASVIADGSITAAMLASGAAVANLGYQPVNKIGDTMTGDLIMDFTPSNRNAKGVGFRGAGANNTQNGTYTFALADTGRTTKKTDTSTPTWTIPPNASVVFAENDILAIENTGASGDITIARGAGVSLRANGSADDENKTLAPNTVAVLKNVGLNSWILA